VRASLGGGATILRPSILPGLVAAGLAAACARKDPADAVLRPEAAIEAAGPDAAIEAGSASCEAEARRCDGLAIEACSATGEWREAGLCAMSEQCRDGACLPVLPPPCTPGARRCAEMYPQTCDDAGRWRTGRSCSRSSACSEGVCVPWRPPRSVELRY
jgi:hypothetical protein